MFGCVARDLSRMKRFLTLLALVAVSAAVFVNSGSARPGRGAHSKRLIRQATPSVFGAIVESGTWPVPEYVYFIGDGKLDLTGLGCPFVPFDPYTEAERANVTATYDGWIRPTDVHAARFHLRTHLVGTVKDASGNTYTVKGNFFDHTLHDDFGNDLRFSGLGRVTLSGAAGVVVGKALLNVVSAPFEYDLYFSTIQQCKIASFPSPAE